MVTIVPSRFAGLKIEDDDDEEQPGLPKKNNKKQKLVQPIQSSSNQQGKLKTKSNQNPNNKKQNQHKKKNKTNGQNEQQWEQWQQRDQEIVDSNYEKDLETALLLSKLEFEEKKTESPVKLNEHEKKIKSGKGKKSQTMGIQEFTLMMEAKSKPVVTQPEKNQAQVSKSINFFESINEQAKHIILREEMQSLGQTQTQKPKETKDSTSKSHEKLKMQKTVDIDSNKELEQLRDENKELKKELELITEKYKKISSVLKGVEVKEKCELLKEIQELKRYQDEMSAEITELYMVLEQEKSKASSTIASDGKYKHLRKNVRFNENIQFDDSE